MLPLIAVFETRLVFRTLAFASILFRVYPPSKFFTKVPAQIWVRELRLQNHTIKTKNLQKFHIHWYGKKLEFPKTWLMSTDIPALMSISNFVLKILPSPLNSTSYFVLSKHKLLTSFHILWGRALSISS